MSFRVEPDDIDDYARFLLDTMQDHLRSLSGINTNILSAGQAFKGALGPGDGPYGDAEYEFSRHLAKMLETNPSVVRGVRETAEFYRTADDLAVQDFERRHREDLLPPV
jgi:hypothetical protein